MTKLVNAFWQWFISLKLTFVLLGFISLGAVIGMSFDQTLSYDEFYEHRSQDGVAGFLLSFFELYDTFHSWWFSLAILLLALNLIACSIERLPRIYCDYMRPRPYLTDRRLLGLSLKEKFEAKDLATAETMAGQFLQKDLKKTKLAGSYYYYDAYGFARFGVYVVHISLLIIMFSAIYASQNGVDGHVLIDEGSKARFITAKGAGGVNYTYDLGFYVGCDDFRLRTFVDNSPMEYESDLYISPDGQSKIDAKRVRVNEPLSYQGYTFYQSNYRPIVSEKSVVLEIAAQGKKERYNARLNTPLKIASGQELTVEKIYEDFAGLGQALRILEKDGENSTYFHIFRRYPEFDEKVRQSSYSVIFLDSDQKYATGLSVGKVPGISLIFSGFMLLVVGLSLCFFMHPIRFFARIDEVDGQFNIWCAAQGFRHPNIVKDIFFERLKSARAG